jgi:HPr kinase/phosphorylase
MGNTEASTTVRDLYEAKALTLGLRLTGGANGLPNRITSNRIQKLGLAFSGYTDYVHPGMVQFLGKTEISYLGKLTEEERKTAVRRAFDERLCCIIVTAGLTPPEEVLERSREYSVPVLCTEAITSRAIDELTSYLDQKLAPSTTIHGVLVEVFGLGVLITGDSGIGKSECALDLILRGHSLVSDDLVFIRQLGSERLMGSGPDDLRFHMELRGLGIINIKDLFGISAVSPQKEIDLVVELVRWKEEEQYDRVGLEERHFKLLDLSVPLFKMPVASGRNIASLVEVAVRIHMLKKQGYEPASEFLSRLEVRMSRQTREKHGS